MSCGRVIAFPEEKIDDVVTECENQVRVSMVI